MRRGLAAIASAAGAGCVLLLAGCGGESHSGTDPASGRAVPGAVSSTVSSTATSAAELKAQEAALHRQVLKSLHHVSHAKYGGLPKDLRGKQKAPADQVLTARPGHPAKPIQGVTVRLHLAGGGSALATVVGPYVPTRDQGSFHNFTTSHWDVTFTDVHGTVPVSRRLFTIIDEQGTVVTPRLAVHGGGAAPSTAPSGRSLTLTLTARTSIGDGEVRYAPGGRLLAEWDFSAETD